MYRNRRQRYFIRKRQQLFPYAPDLARLDVFPEAHYTYLRDAISELQYTFGKPSMNIFCPCCGQRVKLYRHHMSGQMVDWLAVLVSEYLKRGRKWICTTKPPLSKMRNGGGSHAKLLHWGFLVQKPKEDGTPSRTSGFWKPTKKAISFVRGHLSVPSHALLYNSAGLGLTGDLIHIRNVRGRTFDFGELMRS
jgi:hypothetical protein